MHVHVCILRKINKTNVKWVLVVDSLVNYDHKHTFIKPLILQLEGEK